MREDYWWGVACLSLEKLLTNVKKGELGLDYSGYGLKFNPFPASGVTKEAITLEEAQKLLKEKYCEEIRKPELTKIVDKYINVAYSEKKASHAWIYGDWRLGKSMMLIHVWYTAHKILGDDAIIVYVPKPRLGFIKSIYRYFVKEYYQTHLFEEISRNVAVKAISDFFDEVIDSGWFEVWKKTNKATKDDLLKLLRSGEVSPEDIMDGLNTDALETKSKSQLRSFGIDSRDIINVLSDLFMDEEKRKVTIADLERSREVEDHLVSLLKATKLAGYKMTFVLLDDVEDMIRLWTESKSLKEADQLNGFLDRMGDDLSLLGTMHPTFIRKWEDRFPRLAGRASADRLNFKLIMVKKLRLKDLHVVVYYLLNRARERGFEPPYETYPFTEESIQYISKRFDGVIGYMMPTFHSLLNEGVKKGNIEIDEAFIKEMISKEAS